MSAKSWFILGLVLLSSSWCHAFSHGDSFVHLGKTGYAKRLHADSQDLDYTKDLSLEAVVHIPAHTSTERWGGILTKTNRYGLFNKTYPGFGLGIVRGEEFTFGEILQAKVGDGSHHVVVGSNQAQGVVHIVITWDKTDKTLTMYLNGKHHKSAANPSIVANNIASNDPFQMGFSMKHLQRDIIYVRLWNRLLSDAEAGMLWDYYDNTGHHTLPAVVDPAGMHSEWLMYDTCDDAGNPGMTHICDSSGSNHLELMDDAEVKQGSGPLRLFYPGDLQTSVDTSVTLIAQGGADDLGGYFPPIQYFFEIAEDLGFSQNKKESGWISHFSEWKPILKPGTTYYWRVKAKDASGSTTGLTASWSLETEASRDWFVRPKTESGYGIGDGSSYADAWNGPQKIVFGPDGVEAGDNLYICGVHLLKSQSRSFNLEGLVYLPESGFSDEYPITIRMDCPDDEGLFWGYFLDQRPGQDVWTHQGDGVYATQSLTYINGGLMQDIDGFSGTLLKKADSDSWSAEPGSWYSAGSTAYLKTTDGGDPTGRIFESRYGYRFDLGWSDFIKFYKCNFYGSKAYTQTYDYLIKISDELPSTNITFDSTVIKYVPGKMIMPTLLNHRWTVRNCELAHGANAIYSVAQGAEYGPYSANELTVESNYIHDIGDTGDGNFDDPDSHAVGIQGGSNHLIQNNVIERTGSAIVLHAYPGQIMKDNIVRNNILKDIYAQRSHGGRALVLSGTATAPIGERTGNRFYNNIVLGAQGYGVSSNAPDLVRIYNNLFYNITSPPDLDINGTLYNLSNKGFYSFSHSGSHYLGRNNMFVNVKDEYVFIHYGNASWSLEWDHNLYFNDEAKETSDFYHKTTAYCELDNWIENTPYDNHSIAEAPLLEIIDGVVSLTEHSPAIDAGYDMQRETDAYGNPIYGRPDIGPVEHQPERMMGEPLGSLTTVYADGLFRIVSGGIEAALVVRPAGGWPIFLPTDHRSEWMEIQILQWDTTFRWKETLFSPHTVVHDVGDLIPDTVYEIWIDDELIDIQTTDSSGSIQFYGNLASEHEIRVHVMEQ